MKRVILFSLLIVALVLCSCVRIGESEDKNWQDFKMRFNEDSVKYNYAGKMAIADYDNLTSVDGRIEIKIGQVVIKKSSEDIIKFDVESAYENLNFGDFLEVKNENFVLADPEVDKSECIGNSKWNIGLAENLIHNLDVIIGFGFMRLDMSGIYIPKLNVIGGIGEVDIDLRDVTLNGNMDLDIVGGIGKIDLNISEKYPTLIKSNKVGLGNVNINGLEQISEGWVNKAYKERKTEPVIYIEIKNKIGEIDIDCYDEKNNNEDSAEKDFNLSFEFDINTQENDKAQGDTL